MATVTTSANVETSPADASDSDVESYRPYRFTADDFFRMVETDIIPADRRVELWEGQLFEKMGKNPPHSSAQNLVFMALMRVLPEGWCPWVECPILVDDFTAPLPDFSLVRGTPHVYSRRKSNPRSGEIGLVVEVADSTLKKDLTKALPIYARAGLPYYWIVNLVARRVEVYSGPVVEDNVARYSVVESLDVEQSVPLVLDGREVARILVRNLLPEEAS